MVLVRVIVLVLAVLLTTARAGSVCASPDVAGVAGQIADLAGLDDDHLDPLLLPAELTAVPPARSESWR